MSSAGVERRSLRTMTHRVVSLFASMSLSLVLLLAACSGGLSNAKSDFKAGRLDEAKQKLVALEPSIRTWSRDDRADYVLYRGLVLHALGDREAAAMWLLEAKSLETTTPGTYSHDDRTRLALAWESVDPARSTR